MITTFCSAVIVMPETPRMKPWSVSSPVPGASLTTLLVAVVIVACVYIGREVLVPMTLAILMSFVLAPPVDFLQRWYVPRIVAVIGVVLLAFAGVFSLGGLMISQVNQLASDLPHYQSTLREKIQNLRGITAGTGTLERASEVLRNLSREIDRDDTALRGSFSCEVQGSCFQDSCIQPFIDHSPDDTVRDSLVKDFAKV